ncbi:MAG: PKD domain-containing protein [Candidatus Thermoplasmatota archaeon]|nr:PKD domain-containing protein [Candidatus Thermoplasmatota archaeon]
MELKMLSILIVMLLLPLAAALPSTNAQLEKPNWSKGDFWEYSGTYVGTASMDFENATLFSTIDSDVSLRIDVKSVEIKEINGKYVGCYVLDVKSSVSGTYTYKFGQQQYSGSFDFSVNGTSLFATDNLSIINSDIIVNVDINVPNVPNTLSTETDYTPPFDFMDFPVVKGEKWTSSCTATTIYMGGGPSSAPISFSFECTDKVGDRYIIRTDYVPFIGDLIPINNTLILWSESKGMIDSIRGQSQEQNIQINLINSSYEGKENVAPEAKFSYDRADPSVGDVITFDGRSSTDSDGNIAFYQWNFGDGYGRTGSVIAHQYGSKGNYTVTLTVIDDYGQSDTYSKEVEVSGTGSSSGSSSTPGSEVMPLLLALLAIVLLMKKRR